MPIHNIESVVVFGYSGASPSLMHLCAERGVALTFLTEHGRFMARVTGEVSGNVLLRRRQYRVADSETEASKIACAFILAKMANCRTVLLRAARDRDEGAQTRVSASRGSARGLHATGSRRTLPR